MTGHKPRLHDNASQRVKTRRSASVRVKSTNRSSMRRSVCFSCIGEEYVSEHIKSVGRVLTCSFCGRRRKAISVEDLAELVNEALRFNFAVAEEHPVIEQDSDKVSWELGGDSIEITLGDTLLVEEPLIEALVNQLKELPDPAFDYSDDELQIDSIEPTNDFHTYMWEQFSNRVKHHVRFFSKQALEDIRDMLTGIEDFKSVKGNHAIRTISPDDSDSNFFRARYVNSEALTLRIYQNPHLELGPPPQKLATAGRMNPAGISVFYGSFDPLTCISEIRVPVGGVAAVAHFRLLKAIRVLDLIVLNENPDISHISYFDLSRNETLSRIVFFADFHRNMRVPVQPQDEAIDYVPTQVIADYFANLFEPKLDGIIYSSALTSPPGRNIVLFNHAARVQPINNNVTENQSSKELIGRLEDYAYVIEEKNIVSDEGLIPKNEPKGHFINLTEDSSDSDLPPTLAYVEDSLELHQVTAISVSERTIPIIQSPSREVNDLFRVD